MVPGALPPLAKPSVVRTVESDEEDDGGDDKSGVERFLGGAVDLSKDVVSAGADGAKWTGGQISQVPGGFKEGVEGLAEGGATVYRLSSINRRINPDSHKREQEKLRQAAQYAWDDPVGFGKAAVNYEDLADGRYGEWLGGLGPDALAAAATAGTGVAVTRGTRAVDTLADASDAARDADRASDAAGAGGGSGAADAARELDRTRGSTRAPAKSPEELPPLRADERWDPSQGTPVLGREPDTKVAGDWPGHTILALDDWNPRKNGEWIQSIVDQRGEVYIGSPTKGNLWNPKRGESTVFARELKQLEDAGYRRVGDRMVPPKR